MPHLVKMQAEWSGKGLTVVAVTPADEDAVKAFIEKRGVNYAVLAAATDDLKTWGVKSVPASFLVDSDGKVVVKDDLDRSIEVLKTQLDG